LIFQTVFFVVFCIFGAANNLLVVEGTSYLRRLRFGGFAAAIFAGLAISFSYLIKSFRDPFLLGVLALVLLCGLCRFKFRRVFKGSAAGEVTQTRIARRRLDRFAVPDKELPRR
jgi:hypothetical protein